MILRMNKNGNIGLVFLIFLILIVVFISVISNKLHKEVTQGEVEQPEADTNALPPSSASTTTAPPKTKTDSTKLIRKTIVVRGNDFLEHWFYKGDEVVAKQQVNDGGVLNTEGTIPDGKIDFIDTYQNTKGEEYYRDGVRDGNSTAYFADGKLKETAKYESGKLLAKTEYYEDGSKRFEVDYSDARDLGTDDVEVGIGKLYYEDGKIKFEWQMTRRDPVGFKKSYNQDGTLRYAAFFDENDNMIEEKKQPIEEAEQVNAVMEQQTQP